MRIAVIGFYGHGNPGDERILYCLRRFLSSHDVTPINGFAGLRKHWDTVNRSDLVLFGGGGVIQRRTGQHAHLFSELRPPLACVGISVEATHRDNQELIETLVDVAEFVHVRDEASRRVFGDSPKVIGGPDLTFLYPLDPVETIERKVCGLNLLPWGFWKAEYKSRFDLLMRRLTRKFPWVKHAYPFRTWNPAYVATKLRSYYPELIPLPFYEEPGRPSDADELAPLFPEVNRRFELDDLRQCGTIVAMRLHALIFACQLGIPFISLSYQPKNTRFCTSIGLEDLSVDLFRRSSLLKAVARIRDSRQTLREQLLDMRSENHRKIHQQFGALFARHSSLSCPRAPNATKQGS